MIQLCVICKGSGWYPHPTSCKDCNGYGYIGINRPAFEAIYMDLAVSIARRSTCTRKQVGCVITSTDHRYVYAVGYNGGEAGGTHNCSGESGGCGCLHAEFNAIINCTTARDQSKNVYVTMAPCVMCAKSLINLGGVKSVTYKDDYRDSNGVELLRGSGIIVNS